MNIAVSAEVHGRILLAFKLCARWQRETGEHIDLIPQAGDLGVFPRREATDKATLRHAERDPTELGFAQDFPDYRQHVADVLAETSCPLIFVRGNHEDHAWLDERERVSGTPTCIIDAYGRLHCLKTGIPLRFQAGDEGVTIVGIGRVGPPVGEREIGKPKYAQVHELERVYELGKVPVDVLLTHDARHDFMTPGYGIEEIGLLLTAQRPAYHFFGHYGGPCLLKTDLNGTTTVCKLADLHWNPEDPSKRLEPCSMSILRWHGREQHSLELVDAPWFREYSAHSWRYILRAYQHMRGRRAKETPARVWRGA